ncbi:MAG: gamma-glutamyltransferase, partial [Porticoccaceae bacterium]|nr:gamma-glutamyltransferase [Porticoccaceae bacterium]
MVVSFLGRVFVSIAIALPAFAGSDKNNQVSSDSHGPYNMGNVGIVRYEDVFHPVVGRRGMVSSQNAEATKVGLDILKAGGNAIDASVAVGFALAVTLPRAGNLGGGGFMVLHSTEKGESAA